ncbi:hypothetical protein Nepgr_021452 [Nepenthes gracilis]|uniref:Uncharacterized protein n=1 Tax=Nepenthes gracilis TaxID=150966 RepID=A0AAD3T0Z5_NEPGR|nr:hypothetical protein Nepgr_021452 [Nepenthes gracilis]
MRSVALGLEPRWWFAAVDLPDLVPGAYHVFDPASCPFLCNVVVGETDQPFIPAPSPDGCLKTGLFSGST